VGICYIFHHHTVLKKLHGGIFRRISVQNRPQREATYPSGLDQAIRPTIKRSLHPQTRGGGAFDTSGISRVAKVFGMVQQASVLRIGRGAEGTEVVVQRNCRSTCGWFGPNTDSEKLNHHGWLHQGVGVDGGSKPHRNLGCSQIRCAVQRYTGGFPRSHRADTGATSCR